MYETLKVEALFKTSTGRNGLAARNNCCGNPLSDEEVEAVDDCFDSADINDIELSTLYFISEI